MSELEEILAEHSALASAGAGQFTVDPRRQRELLARLGLQNTAQGFLKLCQGIHRSGAAKVLFYSGKNSLQIVVAHDRAFPENPWDFSEPLGLALLNLSQEYHVEWQFRYEDKIQAGHVSPDSFRLEPTEIIDCDLDFDTAIRISSPAAKWWHRDWTLSVRALLATRLSWTSTSWTWNDQPLPLHLALKPRAQAVILADEDSPGDMRTPAISSGLRRRIRRGDSVQEEESMGATPGLHPAHAVLEGTKNSWSETFFVLDGVLLEGERNLLDRPGVVAVVSADGLTPALSGLELVHDAAFRQRLQGLRPEVSWLDSINQRG